MEQKKDVEQPFGVLVSNIGKELFAEFLSDLSRKRQSNLLVASVIAILVAFTILKPIEATVSGIKIEFLNLQTFPVLAGAVCAYLLIIYGIGVLQDWQYYQYRQIPTFDSIYKIQLYYHHRISEVEQKLSTVLRKDDEETPKQGFVAIPAIPTLSDYWVGDQAMLMKFIQQKIEAGEMNQLLADLNISQDEFNAMLMSTGFDKKKIDFLRKTTEKYEQLNKLRLFFEIVFPVGLSLFAIGSSIWAGFIR